MADNENGKGDDLGKISDSISQIITTVGSLSSDVQQGQQQMHTLQGNFDQAMNTIAASKETPVEEKKTDFSAFDLEGMDRAQFADFMISKMSEAASESILPRMDDKFKSIEDKTSNAALKQAVRDMARDNTDFWDWQAEMVDISKRMPNVTPEDAYYLAKSRNPEKDLKLNPAETVENKEEQKPVQLDDIPLFGGMKPTSSPANEEPKNLTSSEAAEKAWAEVVDPLGNVTPDP